MKFRSKFEKSLWDGARKSKLKLKYEKLILPYTTSHKYNPDFELPNDIIIEAKGYFDPRARSKMVAVKKAYPDKDIRFVFQNSRNKLNRSSKMTYGDWCDKHGFPYAEGTIPEEWWNE